MMELGRQKPKTPPNRYASDLDLARAAAYGEEAAQRALVDKVVDQVRDTAVYLMGSGPDAEDFSQESLIQVLKSIGSFRGDCSLEYWADRITVRTTMHYLRKTRRRERISARMWEAPKDTRGLDQETDLTKIRTRLAQMLQLISKERRVAVVLHHVHGYNVAEISEMTDALPNTVRDRLNKGRKLLRKHVADDPILKDWIKQEGS